jgi:beta-galactosidase
VIGDFVWTAIDYLGESGLGGCTLEPSSGPRGFFPLPDYPWYVSYCGDIDIIGQQKAASYARDVLLGHQQPRSCGAPARS